jgi:hypothetical protein
MGQSRIKLQELISAHPYCIFCGGSRPTETREHCPPRSLFQNRHWPEGFEFPACKICNGGSSNDDLIVAFMARMDPVANSGDADGKVKGLMAQLVRQEPGFLQGVFPTATEARRMNRLIGLEPSPGLTHQQTGVAKIPQRAHVAIQRFSKKLAKAIYFKHTGRIFPQTGEMALSWSTNADWLLNNQNVLAKHLENLNGSAHRIVRASRDLSDQFQYKFSFNQDQEFFLLQCLYGKSFFTVTSGSPIPGPIAAIAEQIRKDDPDGRRNIILL